MYCALTLLGADCLALLCANLIASWIAARSGWALPSAPRRAAGEAVGMCLALLAYLAVKRLHNERTPFWTETWRLVRASLGAVIVVVLAPMAVPIPLSGITLSTLALFPLLAAPGNRLAKALLLRAGLWALPVVIVGEDEAAAEAEATLLSDRSLGYRVTTTISPAAAMQAPAGMRWWPMLAHYQARRLILALDGPSSSAEGEQQRDLLASVLHERAPFATLSFSHGLPAFSWDESRFFSQDAVLLSFQDRLLNPAAQALKLALDLALTSALVVLTAPLLLTVASLVRLDGGPALFAHPRIGAGGRRFNCLKFRTMVVDADQVLQDALARDPALAAEWQAARKLKTDPRVTRLGRFLRATSLDELPQLFNVLRLEMSLVGPRPIVESEIPLYGVDIAHYYAARPGITGLWQVCGRSTTGYKRRVQLDVWYVNNWSFWHDVVVLLKTVPTVLTKHGAY